ncbi:exopolysaccharide biosynthesis protein [Alteromonas pelagimontana]|uniref:Exopolysaccharide biosynthesis protein n=1 Tax=Alteromonas pelagimontana TaxID=1858656 RepID=A0A6M4MBK6_9ALTE|nr:exopolysaccharide biosynthesis protein [Alteromonas pelagimontana]QJR80582.1 exopolysaccharide biosynthesis protein [Alteromonas pelagimontana]
MAEQLSLTGVLKHLDDDADDQKLTIGQVVRTFGGRGYGPLLLALTLIEILPTGAIPGVPTFVSVLIVMVAGQLLAGRESPKVPQKLAEKGFNRDKFTKAREKLYPYTNKIDRILKPRLSQFTSDTMKRVVGGICILLALAMPPLELFPFASSAPALAIALFAVGLSTRDGLVILIGLITASIVAAGTVYLLAF